MNEKIPSRFTRGFAKGSAKTFLFLGAAAGAMLLSGTATTHADEHMVLVDKIVVPPGDLPSPICVPGTGLGTFDISFVDPKTNRYVLADRTNGAVDFFDASDDTYIGRVGGLQGSYAMPMGRRQTTASQDPTVSL